VWTLTILSLLVFSPFSLRLLAKSKKNWQLTWNICIESIFFHCICHQSAWRNGIAVLFKCCVLSQHFCVVMSGVFPKKDSALVSFLHICHQLVGHKEVCTCMQLCICAHLMCLCLWNLSAYQSVNHLSVLNVLCFEWYNVSGMLWCSWGLTNVFGYISHKL
jgi:hypothetical protein